MEGGEDCTGRFCVSTTTVMGISFACGTSASDTLLVAVGGTRSDDDEGSSIISVSAHERGMESGGCEWLWGMALSAHACGYGVDC